MYVGTTFYTNIGGGMFVEDTLSTDFSRNKEFASGFGMPLTVAKSHCASCPGCPTLMYPMLCGSYR